MMDQIKTASLLLIYYHPLTANAPTIMEHVEAFEKYSSFKVVKVNTAYGFPRGLESIDFAAIVLHYSPFGAFPFLLNDKFRRYIASSRSVKIAFFQDEMQYCQERFEFINRFGIDAIFTLIEPKYFTQVYIQNTSAKQVVHTLTGYVCDGLIAKAKEFYIPFEHRVVDVGYRARNLPYYFGRGAREKAEIADKFIAAVSHAQLKVDISTREQDRIYGDDWYKFTANCKFMLGVMAGTSIFDLTGKIKKAVRRHLQENPGASFENVEEAVLAPHEEKINYRTISPRIFECAALHTCMILYQDTYQGILTAGKHYIPLAKDLSNIDTVLRQMQDRYLVQEIVDNAYREIISSGKYHYRNFIGDFDAILIKLGCVPGCSRDETALIEQEIARDEWLRTVIANVKSLRSKSFPGREVLRQVACKLGYKQGE